MKIALVASFALISAVSAAEGAPLKYDCTVIVVDSRLADGNDSKSFQVAASSAGSHGGDPFPFTFGPDQISITANARWRGIDWKRAGVVIASSLDVTDADRSGNQVIMVYDPKNSDESVALECHPTP